MLSRSGRPLVMGVLNVTPDSFSDGGRWFETDAAVAHGRRLFAAGADIVDVGGESTRPGASPVDVDEEIRRIEPVVAALAGEGRVSVDTRHDDVAEAAIAAGATLVNDVSASLMAVAARHSGVGFVAMHMRGTPATMQSQTGYDDVVTEVRDFLVGRATQARELGIDEVWIDPGIGFAKTSADNWKLLARLDTLVATGFPVLVGVSRKRFLQELLGAGPDSVLDASLAAATNAMVSGAAMVRVHDVAPTVQAARLVGDPVEAA